MAMKLEIVREGREGGRGEEEKEQGFAAKPRRQPRQMRT